MGLNRIPGNINRGAVFTADLDVPVFISITDIYFMYPIWRVTDCGYADASGEYDLCMNLEETRLKFVLVSRLSGTYFYRFIPGNWFAKRSGFQTP